MMGGNGYMKEYHVTKEYERREDHTNLRRNERNSKLVVSGGMFR